MMMPRIFNQYLFDDFMGFPFEEERKQAPEQKLPGLMKTDIKETEEGYELEIELPGYRKEELKVHLEDGYLTVTAQRSKQEENTEKGTYIRRERYSGSMRRQFYVGEYVSENEIHAKFADGVLTLQVPKKDPKKVEESRYISIEG